MVKVLRFLSALRVCEETRLNKFSPDALYLAATCTLLHSVCQSSLGIILDSIFRQEILCYDVCVTFSASCCLINAYSFQV